MMVMLCAYVSNTTGSSYAGSALDVLLSAALMAVTLAVLAVFLLHCVAAARQTLREAERRKLLKLVGETGASSSAHKQALLAIKNPLHGPGGGAGSMSRISIDDSSE